MFIGRVVTRLRSTERRHLHGLGAGMDMDKPKPAADQKCAPEQRLHLLGKRVGGDIEILGLDAEQKVAHGAADHESRKARFVQPAGYLQRTGADLMLPDRMVLRAINARGTHLAFAGNQAGKQSADHRRGKTEGARETGNKTGGRNGFGTEAGRLLGSLRTPISASAAMIARASAPSRRARRPWQGP